MAFYDPENITDPTELAQALSTRSLQPVWSLLKDGHEDILRSPLFPPILAVSSYMFSAVPFSVLDILHTYGAKWVNRYKIQPNKRLTWNMFIGTFILHFWNHALYILPTALVQWFWVPPTPLPAVAPKLSTFVWQQIAWIFIFDAYYWAVHLGLHKNRFLYRHVHAVHHQYHSTFAAMTNHLHPAEMITIGMGITVIPWFFRPHIMTYWCWFLIATYFSVEVHSGYNLPFTIDKLMPYWLYGGAVHHDMHHLRPLSNYQPWLGYIDAFFGYDLHMRELEGDNKMTGLYLEGEEEGVKKYN